MIHQSDILSIAGITKSFGHIQALRGVSLEVKPGAITAIVGDNGSGKSTLIKILSGNIRPDSGSIRIGGADYRSLSIRKAMDLALLGVSAYVELDGETIRTVRLALTTAAPIPMRAEKIEALLAGKTLSAELLAEAGRKVLEESNPRSSWRSSAEFRLTLLEDMTVQALEKAIARAKEK